ncbi:MAG: shikimate kinase [Nitrososphaerales archaeon]|nr:shikimate kinase [Nitrososphaerales archaeon]
MRGSAVSFGAVSVVNAIAAGKGATVGVRLKTEATVDAKEGQKSWDVEMEGRHAASPLARETVRTVIASLGKRPEKFGGLIQTRSEIPVGVGLKSSSSSSVAIAMAAYAAFGMKDFEPSDVLDCSVRASMKTGASITGALDDAASCLFGGLNLTDNFQGKVLSSRRLEEKLPVLIRIPRSRSRRPAMDLERVRAFRNVVEAVFEMACNGNYWRAMTLNGLLYSQLLGYEPAASVRAVELGALGAGLSGTGPALAAVFERSDRAGARRLAGEWKSDGSAVLATTVNDEGGGVIE